MRLDEMLDISFLQELIAGGYVRRQFHPSEPLAILNYTERAAFEAAWNSVTLATRGLIYNTETLEIVARPFAKFFNYEQLGPEWLKSHLDEPVMVTDKMDGSLGIIYREPSTGDLAIATRGSFTSDQALHATTLLREKYGQWRPRPGFTYLFEIIYPANRIVLNYHGMDDLVLLGVVDIKDGYTYGPEWAISWDGPRTEVFGHMTVIEALQMAPRDNAEGLVLTLHEGTKVKVKQADYVALHRIVTGMNERAVWERLGNGDTITDIQRDLPEEFWPWVDETATALLNKVSVIRDQIESAYRFFIFSLGPQAERKDFALAIKDHPYRAEMFLLLDDKSIAEVTWKRIKPEAGGSMTQEVEVE